jgi:hypothetical protein
MTAAERADYIRRLLASAPAVTPEQRARLAHILRPQRGS